MNARRITAWFALFGCTWIFTSDWVINWLTSDADTLARLQSAKGIAFVSISSVLIYSLTRRAQVQRQRLEDETRQQRDQLAQLLDITPAAIYSLRSTAETPGVWTVEFIGHNVEDCTGFPHASWEDAGFWLTHVHPDDRASAQAAQVRLHAEGSVQHEYRFLHADGGIRWIDDKAVLIRDSAGRPARIVGAWLDITEQKKSALALADAARRYQDLFDANPIPMWVYDLTTLRVTMVNKAATLAYGYGSEDFVGRSVLDLRPEEQHAWMRAVADELNDERAPSLTPPRECLHRHRDGREFQVEVHGKTFRQGERRLRLVTALDITDRVLAREHARLIAGVFDASQEGIYITDAQSRFISVNRTFTRVTGYELSDLLGKTPAILRSGKQSPAFYQALRARLTQEGRWEGEIWNRRRNGELFPEWLTISVIKDAKGQVLQYLGIFTETTGRKADAARIERLANYDALTDLPSRALLAERARLALATAARQQSPLTVLHLNLDGFGSINDGLGHEGGDLVLRETALRLTRELRADATICRTGGDNFVVLLPGISGPEALSLSRCLGQCVAQPIEVSGQSLILSASMGVSIYPDNGTDLPQLMHAAEVAVHLAKREGRGCVHFASQRSQQAVREDFAVARDLRHAVDRQQLRLHYQAQIDLASGRVVGLEALVRWQHPEWGLVPPGRFIPIAEATGLIQPIGTWVLGEALRQTAQWQREGLPVVPVAVNLSVVQFRQPDLKQIIQQALSASGLPPAMLELELTESVAMEDSDYTIARIADLKQLGVKLSLDDFGTGYSSLGYLKRFAVDKLKIDQGFVRGLHRDPHDEAIVTTVIALARSLGLRTIAEGVETEEQFDYLHKAGCDEIQGYLRHRPAPPDEVALYLKARIEAQQAAAQARGAAIAENHPDTALALAAD